MSVFDFLLLGVVQGLTEFLPISSSGHLWLLQYFWGLESDLSLEVFLHVSSLLAVMVCLRKRIWDLVKRLDRESLQLLWATVVTVPVALLMQKYILVDMSLEVVAGSLMVTGVLIWISTLVKGSQDSLTWTQATLIGLVQGISVLPGISRSGITIVGLLCLKIGRQKAAEISFLLSIPTILGALVFTLKDMDSLSFLSQAGFYISALTCFVVAILTIHFMLRFINRWWGIWAIYCLALGSLLLLI